MATHFTVNLKTHPKKLKATQKDVTAGDYKNNWCILALKVNSTQAFEFLQTFAAPSIAGGRKLNKIKNREVII
jgi:hypothetical protein